MTIPKTHPQPCLNPSKNPISKYSICETIQALQPVYKFAQNQDGVTHIVEKNIPVTA